MAADVGRLAGRSQDPGTGGVRRPAAANSVRRRIGPGVTAPTRTRRVKGPTARDVMTRNPDRVAHTDTPNEVAWKMRDLLVAFLPVCGEHDELHGIIALTDLQRQVATEARAPRGRRIAADSVPLTPRFLAAELALVDAIINDVADTSTKVTRTAAVVAALRVAVKQGIAPTD
jgi:CBS-domain-containing membrane protein